MSIFTYGAAISVCFGSPDDVNTLKDEKIFERCWKDAFAGGLVGAFEAGTLLDEAVEVDYTLGTMCVTQVGPQYKWPKLRVL